MDLHKYSKQQKARYATSLFLAVTFAVPLMDGWAGEGFEASEGPVQPENEHFQHSESDVQPTEIPSESEPEIIDAQIKVAEQTKLNNKSFVSNTRTLTAEDVRLARRKQVTTALRASGTTAIVLGSLSVGLIIAGLAMRGVTGFVLDSSGGAAEGRPNFNTAESDARQRQLYQRGGQLALGGIVTTSILLPVGIGLRVAGDVRKRQDERQEKVKLSLHPTSLQVKF